MRDGENKELLDELKSTWEDGFKSVHEKFEEETKKLGEASAETKASLDKANERLDEIEVRFEKMSIDTKRDEERENDEEKNAFLAWARKGDKAGPDEVKVLTVSDDPSSGFLAPIDMVQEIIKGEILYSPIRQVARVRSTSTNASRHPKRTGVFAAVWVGEQDTRDETQGLAYGVEEIPNHELSAVVDVSWTDLEDSAFDLEAEITFEASEQFGVAEGIAFVGGNGVKKPEGFLSHPDIQQVHMGDANLVKADGLLSMSGQLKDAYAKNATWLLKRQTLYAIRQLKDNNNQYLWVPGFSAGLTGTSPALIDGMPYLQTPDMPTVAAGALPIALGDFRRGYVISDRVAMAAQRDPYTQNRLGNCRFTFRKRVGGQVVLPEAIKLGLIAV
jgi:HK97 family phage major capsid protein